MDDVNKYKELFFEESDEYIQTLNSCLLDLEENPGNKSVLDDIFRAAHTLKGMAATMGYKTMTELTHHMENVFALFKEGTVKVDSDIISLLFKCLDKLLEIVDDLRQEKYIEYHIDDLLSRLDSIGKEEPIQSIKKDESVKLNTNIDDSDMLIIKDAHSIGYNAYAITISLSDDCLLKGARAYLVVNKLENSGEIIHSNPSPDKLEAGEFDLEFYLLYISKLDKDNVNEIIDGIAEIDDILIEEIPKEATPAKEEKTVELKPIEIKPAVKTEINANKASNQTIRVELNRLDHFMNLVSELVIYRTRLEDIKSRSNIDEIGLPLEQVARITSELQDLVLKIRMQPVSVVFNRFPRMIRDLSKDLDKELELVIEGEETELDRTVISELGEPLVHILRNAADHGIEAIGDRIANGKPKKGLIKLSAYQEGNKVVITVSDDGKGIKPENIEKIFEQGFSTVEEVTDISGRGVGMDVVRQKINSLGGTIDVLSEINKGTTFVIKLPLTLSIIQALLINIGEEKFALPLAVIEKVEKIEEREIELSHKNEIYIYRGQAIPIIRMDKKLSIQSKGNNKHLIIILLGSQYYGLLVDNLIGQQEIVIKKLGGILTSYREYLGATILGNGDITLILDVGNICSEGKTDYIEK